MRTKKRILIIDDDETHIFSTKGILEAEGYEMFAQSTPLGTTNLVKQLAPDLVLMDVNMPGLSGDRLAYILRSNHATREVPILLYSSNDEDVLRRTVREQALDGYICKGSPAELRSKIRRFLGDSRSLQPAGYGTRVRD